ncbi:MAG: LysM peptidoglycan-binding domain-containing protein [Lamprobacter sp.]|uniref:LysM peptidoglycan-binding domain-containing protein n=1 Tax=Lamprobacter sp. TaxID=3100796 RepID=UPI002B259C4F|nr:LysM peptidoglycan-binding domain-containing protein [Lamprobacter sp.]MEA3639116.1 LysM peptidoglycan-binding domain-containing protein [Lamprobacter sp.]
MPEQFDGPPATAGIHERLDALADEASQLRAKVAAQSELMSRLLSSLVGLLPVALESSPPSEDAAASSAPGQDALSACQGEIAELSARLQQQQLALDEAQRRAEKAEKGIAAMSEAQVKAETEIERLSTELATARTRQSEAVQHAVELERRLATAEARLSRSTANTTAEPADASVQAGQVPTEPVFYEVRAGDTLSRISARVYGDASAWRRIYEANRDLLATPDALTLGMSLVIP